MDRMRAETVIATHGNTDFDAFAAMLAARRLYPGAAVGSEAELPGGEDELADHDRLVVGGALERRGCGLRADD